MTSLIEMAGGKLSRWKMNYLIYCAQDGPHLSQNQSINSVDTVGEKLHIKSSKNEKSRCTKKKYVYKRVCVCMHGHTSQQTQHQAGNQDFSIFNPPSA